ncbi:MAG TPA: GAF domain-containing sensor histidine kinase [Thermoanaerobaculia bacterium]|nr:GAF domain-containing sensor histidine kinase [Thermoanaerobaculia bacterium]
MSDVILDFIASYAAWSAFKATTITFVTAIVALVMAGVLLILRKEVLKDEDWVLYLGLAFAVFPVQYTLRTVAFWAKIRDSESSWKFIETIAQAIFSNLNSLFFICAALALLYRLPHRWLRTRWVWLLAPFVVSGVLEAALASPWDRFLEALLSSICLVSVSWAMFASSGTRQKKSWAFFNLVGGFLYACLHVVYAIVPALSSWSALADRVSQRMQSLWMKPSPPRTVVDALDAGVFGVAFVLKVSLFVGALLVIMRCLSAFSLAVVEDVLEPVKKSRGDFLVSHGILRAVAESIGADLVALCLRLPGDKADEVLIFRWLRDPALKPDFRPLDQHSRPRPEISTIGKVLAKGEFVHSHDRERDPDFSGGKGYWEYVPGMHSLVNFPLRFHGAVVGCLNFEWQKRGAVTATDVKRIRQATEFLTPVIQAERWLWARSQLRNRLRTVRSSRPPDQGMFLAKFVEDIHDMLSPKSTLVIFNFGFHCQAAVCGVESFPPYLLQEPEPARVEAEFRSLLGSNDSCVEIPILLEKKAIGKIILVIDRDLDPLDRPSLTEDKRQLEVIAALVRDSAFDQYRAQLGRAMNSLYKRLGSLDLVSYHEWWDALREAVREVCLLWVWFDPEKISGSREWLVEDGRRISVSQADSPPLRVGRYWVFDHRLSDGARESILVLPLTASQVELYMGIARPGFHLELSEELPWAGFLERFAEAADLALVRIRAIELETEALQFEMNDLLVHELRSPAEEFALGVEWVREEFLRDGSLAPGDPRLGTLHALEKSAKQFLELAGSVLKPFPLDGRNSVPLAEVLEKVGQFYEGRLAARAIDLVWKEEREWRIEVPFDVAYLVLMTLVRNSRDAILGKESRSERRGTITVQEEASDRAVVCHIDDDGCGIPEENRSRIFTLGFSTKRGSGRGLPLARRALERYGGRLDLSLQPPEGVVTRMTVIFPRSIS